MQLAPLGDSSIHCAGLLASVLRRGFSSLAITVPFLCLPSIRADPFVEMDHNFDLLCYFLFPQILLKDNSPSPTRLAKDTALIGTGFGYAKLASEKVLYLH